MHVGVDVDEAGQEGDVAEVVDPVGGGHVAGQLSRGATARIRSPSVRTAWSVSHPDTVGFATRLALNTERSINCLPGIVASPLLIK